MGVAAWDEVSGWDKSKVLDAKMKERRMADQQEKSAPVASLRKK
jgi:hypothetical protein